MRHQLHENRCFVFFLVNQTSVILDNMFVSKSTQQFELSFEFALLQLVLDTNNLDRHLWRQHVFHVFIAFKWAWSLRLSSIVKSLVYFTKRSFAELLPTLDCLKFNLARLIYLNYALVLLGSFTIRIKNARKITATRSKLKALTHRKLITIIVEHLWRNVWPYTFLVR